MPKEMGQPLTKWPKPGLCLQQELAALAQQGLEQELVYSYLACMTVRARDRRKGVATALLRAAEIQAPPCLPLNEQLTSPFRDPLAPRSLEKRACNSYP